MVVIKNAVASVVGDFGLVFVSKKYRKCRKDTS
jgi:hypothetical protein